LNNTVLGISALYHDAAACIVVDGKIIAAAEEERFTRRKHDSSFPENAIRYCLAEAGIHDGRIDAVAFYDKPILKFHRIMESFLCTAPRGLKSFIKVAPNWLREKLWVPVTVSQALSNCGVDDYGKLYFNEHHESQAASAIYPSPFEEAAILTIDGVGEWACASIGVGRGSELELISEQNFPHSLGLLYSAFTHYCGFRVNSGEYKLMGLAPYGTDKYSHLIFDHLLDLKPDGSFRLDMDYFGFLDDQTMINTRFEALFGQAARLEESSLTQFYMDIARSVQHVTEEIVLRMATHAREITGMRNLCMAGGVALNCVANGRLARAKIFDNVWVQPGASDSGGAIGAALAVAHNEFNIPRFVNDSEDGMNSALLGPGFSDLQIREYLDEQGIPYVEMPSATRADTIASKLSAQKTVGLFDGRMEFGPRALGNRSILADPRNETMQSELNQKIKFRESFRPFAASVLEERAADYFQIEGTSPYMLMVSEMVESKRHVVNSEPFEGDEADLAQRLATPRSEVPAVTHVDYSCRLQSVSANTNYPYYDILKSFEQKTGCGLLINTSFNVRGEPIVCTPSDAYSCFMRTNLDFLVLGSFILDKQQQSAEFSQPRTAQLQFSD